MGTVKRLYGELGSFHAQTYTSSHPKAIEDVSFIRYSFIKIYLVHFQISLSRLPTLTLLMKSLVAQHTTLLTRSQDSCPFISRVSCWAA
jgi:hypothetical protein